VTDAVPARMQATQADQLWDREKDYSKKLFDSAFDMRSNTTRDNKEATQPPGTRIGRVTAPMIRNSDARMDVIRLAAKRDSALGRKFTDQYLDEKKRERQEQATSGGPANGNGPQCAWITLWATSIPRQTTC